MESPDSANDSFNGTQPDSLETPVYEIEDPQNSFNQIFLKLKAVKISNDCYRIQRVSHALTPERVQNEQRGSSRYPVIIEALPGYFTFKQAIEKIFELEQELLPAEVKVESDNHYAKYAKDAGASLSDLTAGTSPEDDEAALNEPEYGP